MLTSTPPPAGRVDRREAARRLGVSIERVGQMVREGKLRSQQDSVGQHWFPVDEHGRLPVIGHSLPTRADPDRVHLESSDHPEGNHEHDKPTEPTPADASPAAADVLRRELTVVSRELMEARAAKVRTGRELAAAQAQLATALAQRDALLHALTAVVSQQQPPT